MTAESAAHRNKSKNALSVSVAWSLLFISAATAAGLFLSESLYAYLQQYLSGLLGNNIAFNSPYSVFAMSLAFGIIVATPAVAYKILSLYGHFHGSKARIRLLLFEVLSAALVLVGLLAAMLVIFPSMLRMVAKDTRALITADEHLLYIAFLAITVVTLLQLPLLMVYINKFHRLSARKLSILSSYWLIGGLFVSAAFTPSTNILNQVIFAIPIVGLYALSAKVINITNDRRQHRRLESRDWMNMPVEVLENINEEFGQTVNQIQVPQPQPETIPIQDELPPEEQWEQPTNQTVTDLGVRSRGESTYQSREIQ